MSGEAKAIREFITLIERIARNDDEQARLAAATQRLRNERDQMAIQPHLFGVSQNRALRYVNVDGKNYRIVYGSEPDGGGRKGQVTVTEVKIETLVEVGQPA